MAVREAAHKAMKARKAALVEASWCRILRAARIQCKEAEEKMYEAEKAAAEAFEAAAAMGVIMYDTPNCPQKTYKMETSSSCGGGGSTTHTITTSFETEFEVDKEVAAAVKTALVRLASCSSLREDDFKELLRKISQNPECDTNVAPLEISSECEPEDGSELDQAPPKSDFSSHILDCKMLDLRMRQTTSEKETKIEDLMHERLRRLKEDELSSLATIVATCGLNAALAEVENGKVHDANSSAVPSFVSSLNLPRRMSSATNLHSGRKQVESELPSLDKFLVKHVTKLEREVLEAKNSRKNKEKELALDTSKTTTIEEKVAPSLETMQTKPPSSELVKEGKETKWEGGEEKTRRKKLQSRQTFVSHKEVVSAFPSLDKYLVKHVSRLEKEVQEAKNRQKVEPPPPASEELLRETKGKENVNMPRNMEDSLDKILVKPVHRLEREKMMAVLAESNYNNQRQNKKQLDNHTSDCQSLDEILVKHVSRLEKEKMRSKLENNLKRSEKKFHSVVNGEGDGGGLGEILVKHKSRLEREKLMCSQESENENRSFRTRREAREKDDLQSAWGGLSLGDSMRPHLSKLERDKAAWIKAEEEERKQILSEV
ncbi:uncharacterized protein LOC101216997 isoform X2 [Cucumis sativus]|nr:uncharacterized protein LOC101216997 isoform X2 [Cucumis sativus]